MRLSVTDELVQAWYSGRLKKFANVPKAYHSSSSPKQVMSPKQLLVRIRRIIRAHAAAVASAAADPAPVLQQPAVSSRRRVAVQIPHETVQFSEDAVSSMAGLSAMGGLMQAGAAAGSADTAGRQLGWADINIQRILTVDPVLALVSMQDLPVLPYDGWPLRHNKCFCVSHCEKPMLRCYYLHMLQWQPKRGAMRSVALCGM